MCSCRRLGARGVGVTWLVADVTTVELQEGRFDVWHDRAVFHFLTSAADWRSVRQSSAAQRRPRWACRDRHVLDDGTLPNAAASMS